MNNRYLPLIVFLITVLLGSGALVMTFAFPESQIAQIFLATTDQCGPYTRPCQDNTPSSPESPEAPIPPLPEEEVPPPPIDPNPPPTNTGDYNVYNNCQGSCPAACGSGTWNCWPSEEEWKGAFCAGHQSDCTDTDGDGLVDQPPQWAYHDVADAVNFVNQNGVGPSHQDWIDRWESGRTWGKNCNSGDPGCDAGCPINMGAGGVCYIDGFQPGAVNPNCPSLSGACPAGCAMTHCPASATDPSGIVCDCPAGDGLNGNQCGGPPGQGGLGYFTDPDCACEDTDPSTDCGGDGGDGGGDGGDGGDGGGPWYLCSQLSTDNEAPDRGDTVRYTCIGNVGGGEKITSANFRVQVNGVVDHSLNETVPVPEGQLAGVYDLTVPADAVDGTYLVQCQVCNSSGECTSWGQTH